MSKIITFTASDSKVVEEWVAEANDRRGSQPIGVIFEEIRVKTIKEHSLVVLRLNFFVLNPLPALFFYYVIKKSLNKKGVEIKRVKYKEALELIL